MDTEFDSVLERLEKVADEMPEAFAKPLFDEISSFAKSKDKLVEKQILVDNPHMQKLQAFCLDKIARINEKLVTDEGMTQEQRKLLFVAKDWGLWYYRAMGGDPRKAKEHLLNALKRRAGVVGIAGVDDKG